MAQEYELTSFEKGDFQDQHGNYWCSAAFLGIGEPVKWVLKDPLKIEVGQKYYGEVKEQMSKQNRPYLRFYRQQQQQDGQQSFGGGSSQAPKKEWQPRNDDAIRAQWAISQAIQLGMTSSELTQADIERNARLLFSMVERVKVSNKPAVDKVFDVNEGDRINLDDIPF